MASTNADPVVVVLQLTGANDYLNTVIPYTNPLYRDNRPNVGVPQRKTPPNKQPTAFPPHTGPIKKPREGGQGPHLPCFGLPPPPPPPFPLEDFWPPRGAEQSGPGGGG